MKGLPNCPEFDGHISVQILVSDSQFHFPLCSPLREAMAHEDLLNMPERADWRQCKNTPEEEVQMRDAFREKFHQYDFNNQ